MYKVYILDDEPKAIDNLEYYIKNDLPQITSLGRNSNPLVAIQEIQSFKPDLLFLDIQMPHLDGFAVLKALGDVDFSVIFITAYEEYALSAIKISALDYLLKPIDRDDLKLAVEKFEKRIAEKEKSKMIETVDLNVRANKIAVHQQEGIHFFDFEEIIRMESDGNYTKIFAEKSIQLLSSKTLKIYDDLLCDHGFIRVHNSHLINHNKVKSIIKFEYIILSDGSQVPLSRRKKTELKKIMGLH